MGLMEAVLASAKARWIEVHGQIVAIVSVGNDVPGDILPLLL
jgi:hypothetical protein